MSPTRGVRPTAVDLVLAAALTIASQLEIWTPDLLPGVGDVDGTRWLLSVTTLAMTTPLVVRRPLPVTTSAVVVGAASVQSLVTTPTEGLATLAGLLVAAYSSSAYAAWRGAAVGAVILVVGAAFIGENSGDHAFLAIVLGAAWLMGFVVGQRSGELARLADDNRELAERLAAAGAALIAAAESQGPTPSTDGLANLTPRELEVVRAIATGRSNAEIASLLVISEWTVKTHVASILRKLGLRDRAQVVVAAYESGLVVPGDLPSFVEENP